MFKLVTSFIVIGAALTATVTAAKICGPLPCDKDVKLLRQHFADETTATVISTHAAVTIPVGWIIFDHQNKKAALDARSDYILFENSSSIAAYKLGNIGSARHISVEVRDWRYFKARQLEDCWPAISKMAKVILISTEDAGQIVYFDLRWKRKQCGD